MQPVRLQADLSRPHRRVSVAATNWQGESPFATTFKRIRSDPSWVVHELDGAHNLMRDCPDQLLQILLDCA